MMSKLLNLYNRRLNDLGENNPKFRGIFSPGYSHEDIRRFMTDHYETLEGAQNQANDFDLTSFYYGLLSFALKKADFKKKIQNLKILDVGCGFGSTTFPLLKLFPGCEILASELSLPMLFVLKQKLAQSKDKDRVVLLQLDAEQLDFKENSFDLVVGAAILHHLFNPEKTIKATSKILKPGGQAIYFEPFYEGTATMGLIYERIIHDRRFFWLDFDLKAYFRHAVGLWRKMSNHDKRDKFFQTLDDKWLFERSYFHKLAKENQFSRIQIYRHDRSATPFLNLFKNHLQKKLSKIPKWIFETIDSYEIWLTSEQKDEMITEGGIILKK